MSKDKRGTWLSGENQILLELVNHHGYKWKFISDVMNRPESSLRKRYMLLMNKSWTSEENKKLVDAIKKYKENWDKIMELFPNRELRAIKYHLEHNSKLNPNVNVGRWKKEEVEAFTDAFEKYGRRWNKISSVVKTRTPIQCINYHYLHYCKKAYKYSEKKENEVVV